MQGPAAEKFVVFSLRLLALSFAVVGVLFVAFPDRVLDVLSDVGEWFGNDTRAPGTGAKLWLALSFAYMLTIAAVCLVAQADVVRFRPLLLILFTAKASSSLAALAFFLFDERVFAYLLNFLVDGALAAAAIWLWALAGWVGRPVEPG